MFKPPCATVQVIEIGVKTLFATKVPKFQQNDSCAECFDANLKRQDSCAKGFWTSFSLLTKDAKFKQNGSCAEYLDSTF